MSDLPRGTVKAGADALAAEGGSPGSERQAAEVVLRAAMPLIERHVRREMARSLLRTTKEAGLYDAFYAWRRSLGHAARTGRLPFPDIVDPHPEAIAPDAEATP